MPPSAGRAFFALVALSPALATGCLLDRSGTLAPDAAAPGVDAGGPVGIDAGDAGEPADVDAARPDAGVDGGALPGDDAGLPSVDAGSDAGRDAGTDAGLDAGLDAGPPALRSCDAIYGGIGGTYERCAETETTCTFYWGSTSRQTCAGGCASVGGSCLSAYDNGFVRCPAPGAGSCDADRYDQVCVCARIP